MSLYKEFKAAFEDIIVPELQAIRHSLQALRGDVWRLRTATQRLLRAEVHRLDGRIDVIDRELIRPRPCSRSSPRCRAGRRHG